MLVRNNAYSRPVRPVLLYAGVPLLVTAFLWLTGSHELSVLEILAALALCWIPWASYQNWYRGARQELPLFSLLAAMYWVSYAVPLFWGSHVIGLVTGNHRLSQRAIADAMYLATGGVVALWLGMRITASWRWDPATRLDIPQNPWRWQYLRFVLLVTVLMRIVIPITAWGQGGRQIIVTIESLVASVAFVIFFRTWLRGTATGADKFLATAYFVAATLIGLSSGWLGTVVALGITCIAAYVYEKRKFPITALLLVLPVVLFLQPGKAKFREVYWKGGPSDTRTTDYVQRISVWIDASLRAWDHALTDPSGAGFRELSSATLSRLSLLEQTANVIEMTPSQIPHQHARLYSYLPVTFVPRMLWPGKPSITDANKWYQLSYQLTAPEDIESVGISVGTLTEAYISFGWLGPVAVMLCLGLFLGVLQVFFMRTTCGLLLSSIGIALLPGLLVVESQMAVYVAGLIQQVLFAFLVLAPVITVSRRSSRALGIGLSRAPVELSTGKMRPSSASSAETFPR